MELEVPVHRLAAWVQSGSHTNYHRRWLHKVLIGKLQHSMVKIAFVGAVFQVLDAVVPMKEVFGVRLGHKVWIRIFQYILILLVQTLGSFLLGRLHFIIYMGD